MSKPWCSAHHQLLFITANIWPCPCVWPGPAWRRGTKVGPVASQARSGPQIQDRSRQLTIDERILISLPRKTCILFSLSSTNHFAVSFTRLGFFFLVTLWICKIQQHLKCIPVFPEAQNLGNHKLFLLLFLLLSRALSLSLWPSFMTHTWHSTQHECVRSQTIKFYVMSTQSMHENLPANLGLSIEVFSVSSRVLCGVFLLFIHPSIQQIFEEDSVSARHCPRCWGCQL